MDPLVAIVILNWNGRSYLEQFLPSVMATRYSNMQVIVADNASSDDSVDFLQQHYPSIRIIRLAENFGFAKGYNEALKEVSADYYLLLNSDVEVEPGWLQSMVVLMEERKDVGAIQPKLLSFHQKGKFEYAGAAGGWIDTLGYPFARGRVFEYLEEDKGQYNEPSEIFWATGAAMMIRPGIFHQLGGFDPFFFAHMEEIDLCWRIQLSGWKIMACPSSIVYHVGGGTLPRGNARKTFLNFRNNMIMLMKNLHPSERWWKVPLRIALDWIFALKAFAGGQKEDAKAVFQAHAAARKWRSMEGKQGREAGKKIAALGGVYRGSIILAYFLRRKKKFSELFASK